MRCRHCNVEWETKWEYCPECHRNYGGAVYPQSQTMQELANIDALVATIHNAFAGVQREDGTTIHEADLEGAYSDDRVRTAAREKDPETHWTDVPDWKIERFSSALSFFDPKGWRFYIPAYMCWTLKNWRTSNSITVDSVIWGFEPFGNWSIERYSILSQQQAESVFALLDFFCKYSGEPEPKRAIEAYWHRFRPVTS